MSLRNPVKYPVKYYSWQDTQAPQLSDADGVIKTILKACLVTGYGSKAGAGWTSLFEDAYRIVLRRPLRTGNPPDIKIENGTITGTTVRHRIVAQDNPSSLDDSTEIASANLIARQNNSAAGTAWHCFVTDFALCLCYQLGNTAASQNILFIGSPQKLKDSMQDYFIVTPYNNASITNGKITSTTFHFFNNVSQFYDFRRNIALSSMSILSLALAETDVNNDYFAQPILVGADYRMPFFCAVPSNQLTETTIKQVTIANRPMLRFVSYNGNYSTVRPIYIPLDYWEL